MVRPWLLCAVSSTLVSLGASQGLPLPGPSQHDGQIQWAAPPARSELPVIATYPKAVQEARHEHSKGSKGHKKQEEEEAEAESEIEGGGPTSHEEARHEEAHHEGAHHEEAHHEEAKEAHAEGGEIHEEAGEAHAEGGEFHDEEEASVAHAEGGEFHEHEEEEGGEHHGEEGGEHHGEEGGEHHGEHGEHHGEEGAEAEAEAERNEAVDLAVAATLLGGVAFVMGTFYLVNHSDKDIQLNAWEAVSSTISIFVAVLFFGGVVGITEMCEAKLVGEEAHHSHGIRFGPMLQVVSWFFLLHATIGKLSAMACRNVPEPLNVEGESYATRVARSLEAWSTLFAHVSAFATIHAGLELKHSGIFPAGVMTDIGIVLLFCIVLFVFFRMSDCIRSRICSNRYEHVLKLWDAVAEEAENDVGSLALSFLTLEAVVGAVTGEGSAHHGHGGHHGHHAHHSADMQHLAFAHTLLLLFAAGVFFALRVGMMYVILWCKDSSSHDMEFESTAGLDSFSDYSTRWLYIMQNVLSMCFAWCFYFMITWETRRMLQPAHVVSEHSDAEKAVVALIASMVAFGAIMILDYFSDKYSGADTEMLLRGMIRSLGVLVGFSWEHAFEGGVEVISELTAEKGVWYPLIVRLGMALIIGLGITPAWERYILRNVLNLRKALSKEEVDHGRPSVASVQANAARQPSHQHLMLQGIKDVEAYTGEDVVDREGFMVSIKKDVPKEMQLGAEGVFTEFQAGSNVVSARSAKPTPRSARHRTTPRDPSLPAKEGKLNGARAEEMTALLSDRDVHCDRRLLETNVHAEIDSEKLK